MNLNYPCICGHEYKFHNFAMTPYFCNKCYKLAFGKTTGVGCQNYVPDNLKYLENLNESR